MLKIVKGPYLQWPTRDSMTVMWETSAPADSEVRWYRTARVHCGLNGQLQTRMDSERIAAAKEPSRIHRVVLKDLQPQTVYHYRVASAPARGRQAVSERFAFQTAPERDTPFSFAVTSETGGFGKDDINRQIFAQMRRFRPDFLLMVGDAVRNGSRYEDWETFFFGPGRELLTQAPFFLCPGNHEENADWMYAFTASPAPKNYYAFDYGNARFIALDSTAFVQYRDGKPVLVETIEESPQFQFLRNALRTSRSTWKFVFFHYPPYVSGDYQVEEMRKLCPLLERYRVDLVFNSHTIVYERSHPLRQGRVDHGKGTIYMVVGGAGAMPEWLHVQRAWHTAQSLAVPHFVQAVLAGPVLELHAVDLDGHLLDTLRLDKAGGKGGATTGPNRAR